ncbi:hypothetical protein BZG02_17105 [Labilibaculum filiforme]|uniref:Uncharacterized protein n=1 Tax=Labilibaculum filiforme TaxID=1940526 RepID=A0A2N3HSH5_9BACT|nr:hypothetical protein [Labilibaculum filiforme]PKQ61015.1 hypothetical protein BZG02_17105 [Labilibaculum filiforme]
MLEQTKIVLANVSFDLALFRKELTKAFHWLTPTDFEQLKNWCLENYSGRYHEILSDVIAPQPSF